LIRFLAPTLRRAALSIIWLFYVAFRPKSNSQHRTGFHRSEWFEPDPVRGGKPLKTLRIGQ